MKKFSFFIALILSLNTGIIVNKEEESCSIVKAIHASVHIKPGSHAWLQAMLKKLKIGFYLLAQNGKFHKIDIYKSENQNKIYQYKKLADNCLRIDYFEKI